MTATTKKPKVEALKDGYYLLITGREKTMTLPLKVGSHGAGLGRLMRAAKYAMRHGLGTEPIQEYHAALYMDGFRKATVVLIDNGKTAKVGVEFPISKE